MYAAAALKSSNSNGKTASLIGGAAAGSAALTTASPAITITGARKKAMPRMDEPWSCQIVTISPDPLPSRNGDFPWIDRAECPILPRRTFFPTKFASKCERNGRELATGPCGGPHARHRSEAATGVTRRGARGGLLPRCRGLHLVLQRTRRPSQGEPYRRNRRQGYLVAAGAGAMVLHVPPT